METLYLACGVVIPLTVYMALGMMIRKLQWLDLLQLKKMNMVIFKMFIPLTLFFSVYEADLGEALDGEVFLFAVIGVLLVFLLTWVVVTHSVKEQTKQATIIQGIYRSNFVLFGNIIAASLCDAQGVALVAALAAVVVPMFNVLSVFLFELKKGGKASAGHLIKNVLKNPLVEAGILGLVFNVFNIQIPQLLQTPLKTVGNIATPLALIVLGGLLTIQSIQKHIRYLTMAVVGRLLVVPMAAVGVAILFGFRGSALVAVLAVFGSPTAVASTPMAQAMGGDGILAGEIVAISSACSIFSIFLFTVFFSGAGLL